jgi:hypothetical protein
VNVPSLERTLRRVAWGFIYLIANNSEMHDASINLDKDPCMPRRTENSNLFNSIARQKCAQRASSDVAGIGEGCDARSGTSRRCDLPLSLFPSGMMFFCDNMSVSFQPTLFAHIIFCTELSHTFGDSVHEKGV